MTRLLLTILVLGGIAAGVPYCLLRKSGGVGRSVLAYALGLLVSSSTSIGTLLITQAVLPAPIIDADRIIGSGLLCAVLGPILGVLAAKRLRLRAQAQSRH
ncbi:MAG TPA: hypothetical protein VGN55_02870 [Xanthobacteraceae bacterium]|jgi:hypothetical protein